MDVKFFPRSDYQVEVCAHRFGKSMTYTEQSDAFRGGAEAIAQIAANNNIKFGVFWAMSTGTDYRDIALPYFNSGKMWIDAYLNPSGASGGGTITQEAYETQRDASLQRIGDWFGIRPIAMSFAYGNDSYKDYSIEDYLAGRNSGDTGGTPYGVGYGSPNNIAYSKSFFKSKQSTSRWYDDAKADSSFAQRLAQLESDVLATKQNHGWYNNFTHWHNVISDGNLSAYETYLNLLATLNQNNDIYFAGYGEAVAYLVYRQIIKKVSCYTPKANNNQIIIRLETDNTIGINTSLLSIPISIKFTTVGTPIVGQNIICRGGNLINLGNNQYIVEIPFGQFPFVIIEKISS